MLAEWGIPIASYEARPASLDTILDRFVNEAERAKLLARAEDADLTFLLRLSENLTFNPEINPENSPPGQEFDFPWDDLTNCPHFSLVALAAHLAGKANAPAEYDRFLEIYCGKVAKHEDTIGIFGPLSGREGTEYTPFSRCWATAKELYRLIDFMRHPETVPQSPERGVGLDENGLRQLLNQREEATSRNKLRGQVIAHWQGLKQLSEKYEASGQPLLPPPQEEETESETPPASPRIIYDATFQVDLESPEYRQIVEWVNGHVLPPLLKLIGERNLQLGPDYYLGTENTAANCPIHPRGGFVGSQS